MEVIVIGAGIGGLTLAQALRRAGVDCRVYDRDRDAEDTGGYRLHLTPAASAVLRRHLPPELYQALLASSVGDSTFRRFHLLDHRMRVLASRERDDIDAPSLQIGRLPLRRLLTSGLGDDLRFGAELTRFEEHRGTVTAHFADGHTDRADLLVGADGAHSRIARALAGRPVVHPLGAGGLVGRTPLSERTRPRLPRVLGDGPALAFGPAGFSVFLAVQDPARNADLVLDGHARVAADLEPGYLVWGINADHARYPADPTALGGPELHRMALHMLRGWAAPLRDLVRAADVGTVSYFSFHAVDPDAPPAPWRSGRVTALGDAVHAMPPTGGQGASTAVRDAGLLADELAAAATGASTVPLALHAFERGMARYAPSAVRESLAPLALQRRGRGPIRYQGLRAALAANTSARRLRHLRRPADAAASSATVNHT